MDEALYDRVQLMRRQRARTMNPGRPSPNYLLRGLARCRRCNARMQGTTGGRANKPRYYCASRRANHSCDQPIILAEQVEQQLAAFLTGFAPNPAIRKEILTRLSTNTPESSDATARRAALEQRLARGRDLYELGDRDRPEYIVRRDAIHAELDALAPEPTANLDQASKVLEDFAIFWSTETDPAAKRQFLSLVFGGVWLDHDRVVAVQPKPSFLPFFEQQRPRTRETAGVNDWSDGVGSGLCTPGDRGPALGAVHCWFVDTWRRVASRIPQSYENGLSSRAEISSVTRTYSPRAMRSIGLRPQAPARAGTATRLRRRAP